MTINAIQFDRTVTPFEVDDFDRLIVSVISGDEVITVEKDGKQIKTFDCGVGRIIHYFDGEYSVTKAEFNKWMKRKDSYEWMDRKNR